MPFPLLLFIIIPVTELFLILAVADLIGGWLTLGLVLVTAFIGISVLKKQGFNTLRRAQSRLQDGQLPAQEIVEGMLLAFAGALLLMPGFITDTVGFTLLAAPIRQRVARKLAGFGPGFLVSNGGSFGFRRSTHSSSRKNGDIFEGEIVDKDDSTEDPRRLDDPDR